MAKIDFDKAGDGYMLVPAGTYKVRISKAERKVNKSSGKESIQWSAVVIEGPQMGASLPDFTSLTDAGIWKTAKFIKAAGIEISGQMDTDSPVFNTVIQACVGNSMHWLVAEDVSKDGNPINKVEAYSIDPNQPKVQVTPNDDAPAFAK